MTARKGFAYALGFLAVLLLIASLASLTNSNAGVIRLLDLVRQPLLYLAVALGAAALLLRSRAGYAIGAMFGIVFVIQLVRLFPYLPFAPEQVALSDDDDNGACFTAIALNVKQSNDRYSRVAGLIERENPDLLLLMETNGAWMDALEPQLAQYPERLSMPLENKYGMAFASRVPVIKAKMITNTSANTPTLYATLRLNNGSAFEFVGLHPRPPLPGESTRKRDQNIARAGAITPGGLADVVVMGDFNDVPWSTTTTQFRNDGDYRDPRAGRGTYPTFPASMAFIGWPLDQIMVKNAIRVQSFEILEDVGADHLPMKGRFCLRDGEGEVLESFEPADGSPVEDRVTE